MAARHGAIAHIGYGRETNWGVGVAPTKFVEVDEAALGIQFPQREIPQTLRARFGHRLFRDGGKLMSGTMRLNASGDNLGDWLLAALGGVVNSTVVSTPTGVMGAYHKFSLVNSVDLPSFTLEENKGGLLTALHAGVSVSRLTLDYPSGGILGLDLDLRGQGADVRTTAQTASFWADAFFDAQDLTVQIPSGTSNTNVEAWRLELDNMLLDNIWTAGNSGCISKLPRGGWRASGHLDFGFEVSSQYVDYLNANNISLAFVLSGDVICSSPVGLAAYWLRIDLPKVKFMTHDAGLRGSDRITQGIDFEALYDATAGYDVQAELVNTVQSYS